MKQELTWGAAAVVAIVAAVGISSQPGSKPGTAANAGLKAAKSAVRSIPSKSVQPQCADSISLLEHFFLHENIAAPESCYDSKPGAFPAGGLDSDFEPNFVIATVPDPLHTHFSLL